MIPVMHIMYRSVIRKVFGIRIEQIACTVLVLGMFALVFDYVRLHREFSQFKQAHSESVKLVHQVKEIKLALASIDKVLNNVNRFSSKLKLIAQIPEKIMGSRVARRSVRSTNQIDYTPTVPFTELKEKIDLESIQLKLGDLHSEARKQDAAMAELHEFYGDYDSLLASIPWKKPARGYVTSAFGFRKNKNHSWQMHEGIDIAAYYGTNVVAPADGLVEKVGYSPSYGRYVVIDHGYGLKTKYGHTSRIMVKPGQYVKRGKRIALVGRTGRARGTHLHYEVKLNGVPIDPMTYFIN